MIIENREEDNNNQRKYKEEMSAHSFRGGLVVGVPLKRREAASLVTESKCQGLREQAAALGSKAYVLAGESGVDRNAGSIITNGATQEAGAWCSVAIA
jgi:hypothetical protein